MKKIITGLLVMAAVATSAQVSNYITTQRNTPVEPVGGWDDWGNAMDKVNTNLSYILSDVATLDSNVWSVASATGAAILKIDVELYGQSYINGGSTDGYGSYEGSVTQYLAYADFNHYYTGDLIDNGIYTTNTLVHARGPSLWGPECSAARYLYENYGIESTFTCWGWGGKGTYDLAPGNPAYTAFTNLAAQSAADFGVGDAKVLIYLANVGNISQIGHIEEDYTALIDALLADRNPDLLLMMEPNDYELYVDAPWQRDLRGKIDAVVAQYTNVYLLSSFGLTIGDDGTSHHDADGIWGQGINIGTAIVQHLKAARDKTPMVVEGVAARTAEIKRMSAGEANVDDMYARTCSYNKLNGRGIYYFDWGRDKSPLTELSGGLITPIVGRPDESQSPAGNSAFITVDLLIGSGTNYWSADGEYVTFESFYSTNLPGGTTHFNRLTNQVGSLLAVTNCNPADYNGLWRLTAADPGDATVTLLCTNTATYVSGAKVSSFIPLAYIVDTGDHDNQTGSVSLKYTTADPAYKGDPGEIKWKVSFSNGVNLSTWTNITDTALEYAHERFDVLPYSELLNPGENGYMLGIVRDPYNGKDGATTIVGLYYSIEYLLNGFEIRDPKEYWKSGNP